MLHSVKHMKFIYSFSKLYFQRSLTFTIIFNFGQYSDYRCNRFQSILKNCNKFNRHFNIKQTTYMESWKDVTACIHSAVSAGMMQICWWVPLFGPYLHHTLHLAQNFQVLENHPLVLSLHSCGSPQSKLFHPLEKQQITEIMSGTVTLNHTNVWIKCVSLLSHVDPGAELHARLNSTGWDED